MYTLQIPTLPGGKTVTNDVIILWAPGLPRYPYFTVGGAGQIDLAWADLAQIIKVTIDELKSPGELKGFYRLTTPRQPTTTRRWHEPVNISGCLPENRVKMIVVLEVLLADATERAQS